MKPFTRVALLLLLTTAPGWTQETAPTPSRRTVAEIRAAIKAGEMPSTPTSAHRLTREQERVAMPEYHRAVLARQRLEKWQDELRKTIAAMPPDSHTVRHTFHNGRGGTTSMTTTCTFWESSTDCTTR